MINSGIDSNDPEANSCWSTTIKNQMVNNGFEENEQITAQQSQHQPQSQQQPHHHLHSHNHDHLNNLNHHLHHHHPHQCEGVGGGGVSGVGVGSTNTGFLGIGSCPSSPDKDHLAISELMASTLTASFWNFRSRFERLLLFIVFVVSILCIILLVLMVLLLINAPFYRGIPS